MKLAVVGFLLCFCSVVPQNIKGSLGDLQGAKRLFNLLAPELFF